MSKQSNKPVSETKTSAKYFAFEEELGDAIRTPLGNRSIINYIFSHETSSEDNEGRYALIPQNKFSELNSEEGYYCYCKVSMGEGGRKELIKEYKGSFQSRTELILDVRTWLASLVAELRKWTEFIGDPAITLQYVDSFLIGISKIQMNQLIEFEDGFKIELYVISVHFE